MTKVTTEPTPSSLGHKLVQIKKKIRSMENKTSDIFFLEEKDRDEYFSLIRDYLFTQYDYVVMAELEGVVTVGVPTEKMFYIINSEGRIISEKPVRSHYSEDRFIEPRKTLSSVIKKICGGFFAEN